MTCYCATCKELVCSECWKKNHKGHDIKLLESALYQAKKEIEDTYKEVRDVVEFLADFDDDVDDQMVEEGVCLLRSSDESIYEEEMIKHKMPAEEMKKRKNYYNK